MGSVGSNPTVSAELLGQSRFFSAAVPVSALRPCRFPLCGSADRIRSSDRTADDLRPGAVGMRCCRVPGAVEYPVQSSVRCSRASSAAEYQEPLGNLGRQNHEENRSDVTARLRRRSLCVCLGITALIVTGCSQASADPSQSPAASASASATADTARDDRTARELVDLEAEFDARVGVSALDTGTGESFDYRGDERFGYASTLKAFVAAEFLRTVPAADRGERVTWTQADVDDAGYSPVTGEHVASGLTLAELAEAAVRVSDNAATNIVLERIGGPEALDAMLQMLGDSTTEVVHYEPELNDVVAGESDDTTTPSAFTTNLAAVVNDEILTDEDLATLLDWMSGNATGDTLIRAGAPDGWTVADKSGGAGAIRNDIAVVTRPTGDPIVISVLSTRNDPNADYDDALVAGAAEIVLRGLS